MVYHFSIGAVFKNEAHALDEWIQHYLMRGVDHIYLINDFSTDAFKPIIDKYAEKITLYNCDIITDKFGRQGMIYDKYLKPILHETKYIGIFDLDEFLYSPSGTDFKSILEKYNKYSQITVKWLNFGSSGHIEQPPSIIDGFLKRAKLEDNNTINGWSFKTIVRSNCLKSFEVHYHICEGERIELGFDSNELLINHYINQSLRFYMDIKCTRGSATNFQNCGSKKSVEKFSKTRDRFDVIDSLANSEIDERLKKQTQQLKGRI
jgi:hypothetical protein